MLLELGDLEAVGPRRSVRDPGMGEEREIRGTKDRPSSSQFSLQFDLFIATCLFCSCVIYGMVPFSDAFLVLC